MPAPNTKCVICETPLYRRPCHLGRESVCSRACKAAQTERQFVGKPQSGWRPICSREEMLRDYVERGLTEDEIAAEHGVTRKPVSTTRRFYGIPARRQIKRDQRGEKNTAWRGESVGYKSAHSRVSRVRGRPLHCEKCGASGKAGEGRKFEWANLNGQYHDPSDYIRLCVPCHREMDGNVSAQNLRKTHCPRGHAYDEVNTYWYGGHRQCRQCRVVNGRKIQARTRSRA